MSHRAVLGIVVLLAVAGLIFLFAGNPFGGPSDLDRDERGAAEADLRDAGASDADLENAGTGGLAGRYGAGDLGAVRLRLLDVQDAAPLGGETILLVARRGDQRELKTSSNGTALFVEIPPGKGYRLEIAAVDHSSITIQGVTVVAGETTDLGDVLLGQNLVLRGRIVDVDGRPIPGASASVYTPARGMLSQGFLFSMVDQATNFPAPAERAIADNEGWFTLATLRTGTYRLEARHDGYATAYETDVVVSEERPARHMTIILGEGAKVSGRVTSEDGRAIIGAQVVAIRDSGNRFFSTQAVERDLTTTDANGRYVMDTLTKGESYRFGVIAPKYAPVFETQSVALGDQPVERDFVLVEGGTITGLVLNKDDGEPIAGAEVVVAVGQMGWGRRGRSEENAQMAAGRTKTDAEGRFTLEQLVPGPIMSGQVKASGFVTFSASQWTGNPWGDVEAGEILEVVVELEPGGTVEGVVKDGETGALIAGAQIMIVPRGNMWRAFGTGSPTAETNAEGYYRVDGVRPDTYGAVAVAPGYAPTDPQAEETKVEMPEAGGVVKLDLELTAAGTVTGIVTDSQGEAVAGARVRTRRAPEPRSEAGGRRPGRGGNASRFSSMLPGGSAADVTDQDGRFVLEDVATDRRWVISVDATDYVGAESTPFQVGAGDVKEVNVTLTGGGSLSGRVVDDQGRYVVGARVRIGHLPADVASRGRLNAWEVDRRLDPRPFLTDEDGRFFADTLEPGITVVKVEREGYVTFYKRNVVIRADEAIENYTVALTKGEVMEGIVRGADGRPLQGAVVAVTKTANPGADDSTEGEASEEVEPRLSSRTDGDGRFRIENVPPGTWNAVVWFAPGHAGWARDNSESAIRRGVDAGATTVEFNLEASSTQMPGGRGGGGRR
ncbi:MAG: carboxypeptidase regulatory-like domain-containing protein [Planctomycetota bacterium]|jgi:protocatechuate 3,4-dioxygenase beta subunit